MPIRHHLQGHRFDAETVRLMGIAYEMALVGLQQRRGARSCARGCRAEVIELAKAGERNPERLCEGVLKEFGPPPRA